MTDQEYMAQALSLAQKGAGWTSPNPMVGAVIVKDGQVIGQGYHAKCGDLHAERAALAACTQDPAGATMYVTLEPCCHQGRQPPCTEAILEAGIARVVVGSGDPNPKVAGKGLAILRADGEKQARIMEAEAEAAAILRVNEAMADSLKLLNESAPTDGVIKIKALEAFQAAANGKATKIIIPSEIQGLAGLAEGIVETVKRPETGSRPVSKEQA